MSGLTYVITGANRGLGLGFLEAFIARPNNTVVATVRNVASSIKTLSTVPVGKGSKLIIVKLDSKIDSDPAAAVAELKSKGISKVDVLISNAGYMGPSATVLETDPAIVRESFEVNTIGPLNLIKAFYPLLEASSAPKFLVLSTGIGSIALLGTYKVPFFAYGMSKAAVNYLVVKLSYELPKLDSQAFNPGWVQTDMGNAGATSVGMEKAPMKYEDSIKGMVKLFDEASIEKTGTFTVVDGTSSPW